ncbi:MTH1187 family thiamine-binding protein [Thermincola ferriacetica]
MAVVELTVVPLGTGSPSISEYVAGCLELIKRKENVKYQLTPMGTILEGDLTDILELVRQVHEVPFGKGAQRVITTVKIDDRRDRELTMEGKLQSVYSKMEKV